MPSIPPNDHWLQCVDHLQKAIGHLQLALNQPVGKHYLLQKPTSDQTVIRLKASNRPLVFNQKRARRIWTSQENQILIEKVSANWSYREIADLLGRTEQGVGAQVKKLRAGSDRYSVPSNFTSDKRKLWSDGENRTLIELHKEGYSEEEIAELMGRSPKAINKRLYMLKTAQELSLTTKPEEV